MNSYQTIVYKFVFWHLFLILIFQLALHESRFTTFPSNQTSFSKRHLNFKILQPLINIYFARVRYTLRIILKYKLFKAYIFQKSSLSKGFTVIVLLFCSENSNMFLNWSSFSSFTQVWRSYFFANHSEWKYKNLLPKLFSKLSYKKKRLITALFLRTKTKIINPEKSLRKTTNHETTMNNNMMSLSISLQLHTTGKP